MKRVRIERLAASTALGLIMVLASQSGYAQQAKAMSEQEILQAIPMPDTTLPPPPTAEDMAPTKAAAAPAVAPSEPKQDAAAPAAAEPAKAAIAAPAAAPAPAPSGDVAVADKLRELFAGKIDRAFTRKADREGAETYYKTHDYKPVWITDGALNARGKAAIAYLAQVDTVGLNPADYPAPDFKAAATPDAQAEAELKLTDSVLNYARHAQIGQIHFTRVAADISFDLVAPEPAAVLAKLAESSDTAAALDSYNPPQEGFKALKAKLAEIRNKGSVPDKAEDKPVHRVKVPEGKILRPGMKDQRVIALRERLDISGDKTSTAYDDAVRDAVKAFQTEADLTVDGNLGNVTVRALNGEPKPEHRVAADPTDTILVNMERWRWLPRKLGNANGTYVMVNVPDYTLTLTHQDKLFWKTKIVVGKPGKATPMTTAEMKFITVNPTWNVPPSIIENEYLPALREDPQALDRIGLKVKQDPDGTVHIFQPPGAANALGRIRFNFPNKFLVYQHDTPDKYLFAKEERAYSHGCMRVQDPLVYGEKLLSIELPNEHYTAAKIERMFGGNEININFPNPIPVHLTYQTAFVDDAGKLQLRKDIYGRDQRMIAIMKSNNERKVADIAIERRPDASSKPVKLPVGSLGGERYDNGPNFFSWIFGNQRSEVAPPQPVPNRNRSRTTNNQRNFWR